jgi:hypothetical protein
MELLMMQFSPVSNSLLPLKPKYLSQTPSAYILSSVKQIKCHTYLKKTKICCGCVYINLHVFR